MQLNIVPFVSVRLSRALGFLILSKTPVISVASPRLGLTWFLVLRSFSRTRIRRSSSVSAEMYTFHLLACSGGGPIGRTKRVIFDLCLDLVLI